MIRFSRAITKTPAKSLINGLTMTETNNKPDYIIALQQHEAYIETLKSAELSIDTLSPSEDFPDSCFVEDIAVLAPEFAILTRPGAESRREEISQAPTLLSEHYQTEQIHTLTAPALLEGGDVMLINKHFFIGLSTRTNQAGIDQFAKFATQYGYTVSAVPVTYSLHLKTGVTFLGDNTLVMVSDYADASAFDNFDKIIVDDNEKNCANIIRINDFVLVPAGYEQTKKILIGKGYQLLPINISEFEKIDGGLTCLSLRF